MKPRRILMLTKFKRPWNNGYFMARALEDMGYEVIRLDTPSQLAGLEDALSSRPWLALATKADGMNVDMVNTIRQRGIPFVVWYPDPIPPDPHMVSIARHADYFFTMAQGRIEEYRKHGVTNIAWLSQAVTPSFYEGIVLSPEDWAYYGSQVAFVGNLGTLPQYRPRRKMLDRVIQAGFQLKWWGRRPSRKIKDLPFLFSKVCRSYGGEFVRLDTFYKVARAAKIFLSLDSYPEVRLSMSVRIYTSICCGAFYMSKKVEGIEDVFEPGKEIEVFETYEEMVDKIRYYLAHEEKRKAIAEAGRARVIAQHTYQHRFGEMFRLLRGEGILKDEQPSFS